MRKIGAMMNSVEEWADKNRSVALFTVSLSSIGLIWLTDWMLGGHLYRLIFYPDFSTAGIARGWSAVSYTIILLAGLPSAFLLWVWRDRNVRDQLAEKRNEIMNQRDELEILKAQVDTQSSQLKNQTRELEIQSEQLTAQKEQIANQRKEISLKEFQEVQRVAAGLFDVDGPESAKVQLQIAAMHQLRGFLEDEYPLTFRRAAFELLLAGHSSAVVGLIEDDDDSEIRWYEAVGSFPNRADTVSVERAKIIRDDANLIVRSRFPLQGRRFDFLMFRGIDAQNLNFTSSSFVGCSLRGGNVSGTRLVSAKLVAVDAGSSVMRDAHLQSAEFRNSLLSKADLRGVRGRWCKFDNSYLSNANLQDADFSAASFRNANLQDANLSHSQLTDADFRGANLEGVTIDKANFEGSKFDDQTRFAKDWSGLAENAKADYRSQWRDRGMKHIDDTKKSEGGYDDLDDDIPF